MLSFRSLTTRWLVACLAGIAGVEANAGEFASHPPQRPLPIPVARPLADGPTFYVSPQGDDSQEGTRAAPWRTIQHGVTQLKPGDTLVLRGGVYYEHVRCSVQGSEAKPITIRSAPSELAILDGGLAEFQQHPAAAWEPAPGGAEHEYRSVKTYPDLGNARGVNLLGAFADSMTPLHGYHFEEDLRATNEYFDKVEGPKTEAGNGIYCGPGLFYDAETGRIHVRLSHTHQKALGENNYRGETDPRRLPLIVAGLNRGPALAIDDAQFLIVRDLVVRGARTATVSVSRSTQLIFDHVTAYGGQAAMSVRDTAGLRLSHCALRGIAAPWTYRGSLKYRSIEARIFSASGWTPSGFDNRDFVLEHSEFTDCVDGIFIGNVHGVRFENNLVDNLSDDGIFLTAGTAFDGATFGGDVVIAKNRFSRCLTTFAFGVGHGRQRMTENGRQTGSGAAIFRNVFDLRSPVMYQQPSENESQIITYGRLSGDHGSPLWEPIRFYQNTILLYEKPFRSYYLGGWGGSLGPGGKRSLLNNLLVQALDPPGGVLPTPPEPAKDDGSAKPAKKVDPLDALLDGDDAKKTEPEAPAKAPAPIVFQADGNLHWSYGEPTTADAVLGRFRRSPAFKTSQASWQAGWTANDLVADPQFEHFDPSADAPVDLRLQASSPAIGAGVRIEGDDPFANRHSRQQPDIGAIPHGMKAWQVGVFGRLTVDGADAPLIRPEEAAFVSIDPQIVQQRLKAIVGKKVAMVEGYPAFSAPLIAFAFRKHGAAVETFEKVWLPTTEYAQYDAVIVTGDLARAKMTPNQYSAADLERLRYYLNSGGTLLLMRGTRAQFATADGVNFLVKATGERPQKLSTDPVEIQLPKHPWVAHLAGRQPDWLNVNHASPLKAIHGERIIGGEDKATLYRLPFGKGQLIYIGWEIANAMPSGRDNTTTVEQEQAYQEQMRVLVEIAKTVCEP